MLVLQGGPKQRVGPHQARTEGARHQVLLRAGQQAAALPADHHHQRHHLED